MALKQTVITRVEPDAPGWYWYRDTDLDDPDMLHSWQPVETYIQEGKVGQGLLYACIYTGLPDSTAGTRPICVTPVSALTGEWGDEIPLPKAAHKSQTTTQILPKEGTRTGSHRRAPIKAPAESVTQPEQLAKFLYWISERHLVYLRRHWPWPVSISNPSTDFDQTSKKFKNTPGLMTNLAGGQYSTTNQKPWTTDPVLQNNFFCNPFRELDKTTQWFRENVREPLRNSPDVIMATIIFRWFNYIPTGEALMSAVRASRSGTPRPKNLPGRIIKGKPEGKTELGLFTNWDSAHALQILKPMKKVFTGAHVVASGTQLADTGPRDGGGSPKVRSILDLIDRLWEKREELIKTLTPLTSPSHRVDESLQSAHQYLQSFPAIGDFQAYEIVTDLRHTYVLENAPDILTWANAGPGAKRGLNRIFGRPIQFASPSHPWQKEMQLLLKVAQVELCQPPPKLTTIVDLVKDFGLSLEQNDAVLAALENPKYTRLPKGHPPFELREVEHSLCEFDKYMRLAYPTPEDGGPQNSKRKYAGT